MPTRMLFTMLVDLLFKASRHKYVRRVPKGGGKKGYIYYYAKDVKKRSYLHGKGFAHESEIVNGASFEFTHQGKRGHYHIVSHPEKGELVKIKHDETGHTMTFQTKQEFQDFIREHHAENIKTAKQNYLNYLRREIEGRSISLKKTKRRADMLGLSIPEWEGLGKKQGLISEINDFSPLRYKIKLKDKRGRFLSKWVSESTAEEIVKEKRTHWQVSESRKTERAKGVDVEIKERINPHYESHMMHANAFDYPFDPPKQALHPRDFLRDEKDKGGGLLNLFIREKGSSEFRQIYARDYEEMYEKLNELDTPFSLDFDRQFLNINKLTKSMNFAPPLDHMPLWKALLLHLEQLGLEAVFTHGDVRFVQSKEGAQSTIEDIPLSAGLPPNFLGLDLGALEFDVKEVKKRYAGREYTFRNYTLNTNDPLLEDLGFYDALGEGSFKHRVFSVLADASNGHKISDKRMALAGKAIARLSAWWASLGDERRQAFYEKYLDKSKQYQGVLRHPLHENNKLEIPEGMEKMSAKGWTFHEYQKKAINFGLQRKRVVWAMEMGLGKTLSALGLFHHLKKEKKSKRMIVTAPLSAHGSWEEHLGELSDVKYTILTGATKKKRQKAYKDFKEGKIDVLVVSPETVRTPKTHKIEKIRHPRGYIEEVKVPLKRPTAGDFHFLEELVDEDTLFIADEVHKYKGDSNQGESFRALSQQAGRLVGMTGTVKPNKPIDFFNVLSRVNPDYPIDKDTFLREYCITEPSTNPNFPSEEVLAFRPDRLPEFYEMNAEMLFTRSTSDSDAKIDLPDRIDLSPRLQLDEKQKELLEELPAMMQIKSEAMQAFKRPDELWTGRDFAVVDEYNKLAGGGGTPLEQVAFQMAVNSEQAVMIRLDQVTVSPATFAEKDVVDKYFGEGYETPKMKVCMDAVKEHLENHPQTGAVVFCEYKKGLEEAKSALISRGFSPDEIEVYHGGVSSKKRREIERRLNEGEIKVVVGQTKSLETGANLQKRANLVVHLNTPWAPDTLTQSTARVYRQGQQRKTTILRPTGSEIEVVKDRIVSRKLIQSAQATGTTMRADKDVLTTSVNLEQQRLDTHAIADLLGIDAFRDLKLEKEGTAGEVEEVTATPEKKEEGFDLSKLSINDIGKNNSELLAFPSLSKKSISRFQKGLSWSHDKGIHHTKAKAIAESKGRLALDEKTGQVLGGDATPSNVAFWAGVYVHALYTEKFGQEGYLDVFEKGYDYRKNKYGNTEEN